ncbi:unnamed protein product, partial [Ectocarpus sp. 8 AP-2014]
GASRVPKSLPPALAYQAGRVEPGFGLATAHKRHTRPAGASPSGAERRAAPVQPNSRTDVFPHH